MGTILKISFIYLGNFMKKKLKRSIEWKVFFYLIVLPSILSFANNQDYSQDFYAELNSTRAPDSSSHGTMGQIGVI